MVAKSGSGLADIVTTANYDATCTSAVKCNQPNYVIDPLGNRTDYSYDTTHGQVTRVQLPSPDADAAGTETGTRPEINYSLHRALVRSIRMRAACSQLPAGAVQADDDHHLRHRRDVRWYGERDQGHDRVQHAEPATHEGY